MDEARHERIRAIVASIPEGRWCSYGDVAAAAGERSARVVGTVLSTDGADLPWHRVLRTTGTPAPHIAVEQNPPPHRGGRPRRRRPGREGPAVASGPVSTFPSYDTNQGSTPIGAHEPVGTSADGRHSSRAHVATPTSATTAPSAHTPGHPTMA